MTHPAAHKLVAVAGIAACVVSLAGCGGDSDKDNTTAAGAAKQELIAMANNDCAKAETFSDKPAGWCAPLRAKNAPVFDGLQSDVTCSMSGDTADCSQKGQSTSHHVKFETKKVGDKYVAYPTDFVV